MSVASELGARSHSLRYHLTQNDGPTLTAWTVDVSNPSHLATLRLLAERLAFSGIVEGLVHKLRNPMQSMMFAAQALMEDDPEKTNARQFLEVIRRGSDDSAQFIELLGEINGERSYSPGPVLVTDVVEWALACQHVSKVNIEGSVTSSLPQGLPAVSAHHGDLAIVLTLALNNAREALQGEGSRSIIVTASFSEKGQGVVVVVEDDGSGIASRDFDQPFEPFFTTKEGHLGLGLPVARKLLSAYGAKIRLKDNESGGTRCEIWIPKWSSAGT